MICAINNAIKGTQSNSGSRLCQTEYPGKPAGAKSGTNYVWVWAG